MTLDRSFSVLRICSTAGRIPDIMRISVILPGAPRLVRNLVMPGRISEYPEFDGYPPDSDIRLATANIGFAPDIGFTPD